MLPMEAPCVRTSPSFLLQGSGARFHTRKSCHPSPWQCDKGIAQQLSLAAAVLAGFPCRSRCCSIGRTKPGALPTSLHCTPPARAAGHSAGIPLSTAHKALHGASPAFSPSSPSFRLLSQPHRMSPCYLTSEGAGELAPPPHQAPLRKTTATTQKATPMDAAAPWKVRPSLIQWQKLGNLG